METELVVMPAILSQDLAGQTMRHICVCIRAGVSPDSTDLVQQAVELVSTFIGRTLLLVMS